MQILGFCGSTCYISLSHPFFCGFCGDVGLGTNTFIRNKTRRNDGNHKETKLFLPWVEFPPIYLVQNNGVVLQKGKPFQVHLLAFLSTRAPSKLRSNLRMTLQKVSSILSSKQTWSHDGLPFWFRVVPFSLALNKLGEIDGETRYQFLAVSNVSRGITIG